MRITRTHDEWRSREACRGAKSGRPPRHLTDVEFVRVFDAAKIRDVDFSKSHSASFLLVPICLSV